MWLFDSSLSSTGVRFFACKFTFGPLNSAVVKNRNFAFSFFSVHERLAGDDEAKIEVW